MENNFVYHGHYQNHESPEQFSHKKTMEYDMYELQVILPPLDVIHVKKWPLHALLVFTTVVNNEQIFYTHEEKNS